jgi:hypothetical protein
MTSESVIELLHLFAPVVALAAMAASHALLCRLRPGAAILNLLVLAGFIGLGALVAVEVFAIAFGQSVGSALVAMILVDGPIYACLAYGYANFVNLGHASVRIRIYRELLDSPRGIEVAELRNKYDEAGMLTKRLQRMLDAEDLVFDGSAYRMRKTRLLAISNIIFGLKKAVLGRHSEFTT